MPELSEKMREEALSLPVELRVQLVDELLKSLHVPAEEDVDALWAEEAERRVDQVDRGEVETVPGETVFERAWARRLSKFSGGGVDD
jgi:putative addiction module component (TIGR02574 family)